MRSRVVCLAVLIGAVSCGDSAAPPVVDIGVRADSAVADGPVTGHDLGLPDAPGPAFVMEQQRLELEARCWKYRYEYSASLNGMPAHQYIATFDAASNPLGSLNREATDINYGVALSTVLVDVAVEQGTPTPPFGPAADPDAVESLRQQLAVVAWSVRLDYYNGPSPISRYQITVKFYPPGQAMSMTKIVEGDDYQQTLAAALAATQSP